jgi:hypothetical protein
MAQLSRANYPPPAALHVDDALITYSGSLNQLAYCDWLPLTATSEPPDPTVDGQGVQWVSNGTGDGNAGDLLYKIRQGAVIKIFRLVDFGAV